MQRLNLSRVLAIIGVSLLLLLYVTYLYFMVVSQQGAVDYETFMDIGERFLAGESIWTENSYYPLPYVMIFGVFAALPPAVSIILWHFPLIILVLLIVKGNPLGLVFGPVFAHFTGGQTSVPGLLGFWQYYRSHLHIDDWRGGAWLSLTMIKPQLAIAPVMWAAYQWWQYWRREKRVSRQMLGFIGGTLLIYVPAFLIMPSWVSQWLASPREIKTRAVGTIVPRILFSVLELPAPVAFLLLAISAVVLFVVIRRLNNNRMPLDVFFLYTLLVNPFIHDYDLILLLPVAASGLLLNVAVMASIPTWLVIFFAYEVDAAWGVVTIIPVLVLIARLYLNRQPADHPAPVAVRQQPQG